MKQILNKSMFFKKRKIIATIVLSLSLIFGKTRFSSSQSSSPNFDDKIVQGNVIDNQEFCSLEDNDQQVIFVKIGGSRPSILISSRRGQPSRPVYITKYRRAPKVVPSPALGAGAYSAEQWELNENVTEEKIEIVYRIKENPDLIREAKIMGKNQAAQKDVINLIEQLSLKNDNPGIGNRRVTNLKNVSEARGKNKGRVYFREKDGKIEIPAKSNKANQNKVIGILQRMGY